MVFCLKSDKLLTWLLFLNLIKNLKARGRHLSSHITARRIKLAALKDVPQTERKISNFQPILQIILKIFSVKGVCVNLNGSGGVLNRR